MRFTKSHEWVKPEGDTGIVGITDYAQKELGDIVFVELPRVGEKIEKLSQFGTIESTKAASELNSPVSGEIIEVNDQLPNNPQWINQSPYDQGWIIKVRLSDGSQLDDLMSEEEYKEFIVQESH